MYISNRVRLDTRTGSVLRGRSAQARLRAGRRVELCGEDSRYVDFAAVTAW